MAHTIRGVENRFRKRDLGLDVIITRIPLEDTFGILSTRLTGHQIQKVHPHARVEAWIYINERAPKELARFTIAHEIYHLLLELGQWEKEKKWHEITSNPQIEADCNKFAQALCYLHDKLYRSEKERDDHIHFCEELFKIEIATGLDGRPILPEKLGLLPGKATWETPIATNMSFPWLGCNLNP